MGNILHTQASIPMLVVIILSVIFLAVVALFLIFFNLWTRQRVAIKKYQRETIREHESLEQKRQLVSGIYDRFVPKSLLDQITVSTDEDGKVQYTQKKRSYVSMFLSNDSVLTMISRMDVEEVFRFSNVFSEKVIPSIYVGGGRIHYFEKMGFSIFFENTGKDALVTAISVLNQLGELRKSESNDFFDSYTIGICSDEVLVGVMGNEIRSSVVSISTIAPGFDQWIQNLAHVYYAKLLITEEYLNQIEDAKRQFNIRKLGTVYLSGNQRHCVLYDVYDGDDIGVRNKKRQTKMVFEKGVELYAVGKRADARRYFVEVLRADGEDSAARRYISLCDQEKRSMSYSGVYCIDVF